MPKLPDAGDLNVIGPRAARSFTNVPVADYQGAFGALGRGLSDIGAGAQRYAEEVDKRQKDEEAFGVNLRLADAQLQFSKTTSGLDPSDPEFGAKRMQAWSDTFKPIIEGVKHPENKTRFGEWAYENGTKIQIDSDEISRKANTDKTKLQLMEYMQQQQKLVAQNIITPEQASANVKAQIAQAPYLFDNDKQEFLLKDAPKFDASVVEMTALNNLGKVSGLNVMQALVHAESTNDPTAVSPKGALGLAQVMPTTAPEIAKELGDETFFKLSPAERKQYLLRPDVSVRYGAHYLDKMLKRYNGDLEAALVAYNAGPGNADKWVKAGRNYNALPKPEETAPYVQKILTTLGGPGAPVIVNRRGNQESTLIASLEANPLFRDLPVDQQSTVRDNLRVQYRQQYEEQEKLDLVAGTRAVVDDLISKYPDAPDRQKAEEELRARVKDPLALEDGLDMLNEGYTRKEQARDAAKTELRKTTTAKVLELRNAGRVDEAIAAAKVEGIDPEDAEALRELALKGPATIDNAEVEAKLWRMAYKEPDKFKAEDLSFYQGKLTQATIEKFEKRQADLKDPKKADYTSVRTVGSILDNYYSELGLASGKNASEQDVRFRRLIDTQVGRQLNAFESKAGRAATPDEVQDIVDTTFTTFSTPGSWYGTNTNTIKDVLSGMEKEEGSSGLPLGTLYGAAINDLTKNGFDPTPENLNRWLGDYRNKKQANKANAQ